MKISQLLRSKVLFFNCDIQTVFNNTKNMYNPKQVVQCASLMNEAAGILGVPVIYSEQNVKAFGPTVPEVKETLPQNSHYFEKHTFTMYNEDGQRFLAQYPERQQVVIYGWEAHVCVQQTALDLIRNGIIIHNEGYQVHVLTDGTSSNRELYRSTAYERLKSAGVVLDNSQSVIFELLQSYKDDKFKPILGLFKKYKFEEIFTKL